MPKATADLILETKAKGGRVIAVGTTSRRTLESVAKQEGCIKEVKAGQIFSFIRAINFRY